MTVHRDWDVDDDEYDDHNVEIDVELISRSDRLITVLTLRSSQISGFSFRLNSISKDVGSMCFLVSVTHNMP